MIGKITAFQRCRSKLVKHMSEYYFKEMKGAELQRAIADGFVILKDELRSDEAIQSFVEQEQPVRDPLDTLQYMVFISHDHSPTESLLILKSHHCMCDGIATLVMTSSFSR